MAATLRLSKLPEVGQLVGGRYRIVRTLREGGMGVLYVAEHTLLKHQVAIKVLLSNLAQDEVTVSRFLFEAQAVARLRTEHVARVLDAGALESGYPFIALEYLEGCDVEGLLRVSKKLSVEDSVDYAIQALEGVAQAHAAGIVHRDLKPSNLYLAFQPDGTHLLKVLDFGISKALEQGGRTMTTGEQMLGSPGYMSPEQVRDASRVDERSDLWSLGVVLYEFLTGKLPFNGENVDEIFHSILHSEPVPAIYFTPDMHPELGAIVSRALNKDPDARFESAAAFARALAPFGTGRWSHLIDRISHTLVRSAHIRVAPRRMPDEEEWQNSRRITTLKLPKPSTPNATEVQQPLLPSERQLVNESKHAVSRAALFGFLGLFTGILMMFWIGVRVSPTPAATVQQMAPAFQPAQAMQAPKSETSSATNSNRTRATTSPALLPTGSASRTSAEPPPRFADSVPDSVADSIGNPIANPRPAAKATPTRE